MKNTFIYITFDHLMLTWCERFESGYFFIEVAYGERTCRYIKTKTAYGTDDACVFIILDVFHLRQLVFGKALTEKRFQALDFLHG